MPTRLLSHATCGYAVTIAVRQDDVAIYVWCPVCNDIVETGELFIPGDHTSPEDQWKVINRGTCGVYIDEP